VTTTIAVQPLELQGDTTGEVIELDIFLREVTETFDRLEVWRSRSGESGPYDELTAEDVSFPRLPETADDPPAAPIAGASVVLDGTTLELRVGNAPMEILFSGVDPITFGDAATQVTAQGMGLVTAYVAANGTFVLQGQTVGDLGRLEVTGGTAVPTLGLTLGALSFSKAARIHLVPGQLRYFFRDLLGSREYFYKTRRRNASNNSVSEFSRAFSVAS